MLESKKNEFHAVVELFGHSKIAGLVSEFAFGGSSFVRIDVPETQSQPAFTRMFGPGAIYCINPVTEETCLYVARTIEAKPVTAYDIREAAQKLMALRAGAGGGEDPEIDGGDDIF